MRVYQFRHTGMWSIIRKPAPPCAPAGYLYRRVSETAKENQIVVAPPNKAGFRACIRHRDRQSAAAAGCGGVFSTDVAPMTVVAMKANWSEQLRREPAAATASAIFVLSAATLLGAWYFQYVLKLAPCPLCLEQRLPYHIVIPLSLLMVIAAIVRAPRALLTVGFVAIMVAMLGSAALGAYHAGVEWRWWPGPTECSGPISDFTAKGPLLDQLRSIHVVRCDEAAWRFLGLSLAGYNVLISLALAAIAAFGLITPKDEV